MSSVVRIPLGVLLAVGLLAPACGGGGDCDQAKPDRVTEVTLEILDGDTVSEREGVDIELTAAGLTTPTTVADGVTTVLTVLDHAAVGLDPDTGEQRWSRALAWDPIAAISALGDRVMVIAMDGTFGSKVIVAVDARDGRILWERMLKMPSDVELSVHEATVTVAASAAADC